MAKIAALKRQIRQNNDVKTPIEKKIIVQYAFACVVLIVLKALFLKYSNILFEFENNLRTRYDKVWTYSCSRPFLGGYPNILFMFNSVHERTIMALGRIIDFTRIFLEIWMIKKKKKNVIDNTWCYFMACGCIYSAFKRVSLLFMF